MAHTPRSAGATVSLAAHLQKLGTAYEKQAKLDAEFEAEFAAELAAEAAAIQIAKTLFALETACAAKDVAKIDAASAL